MAAIQASEYHQVDYNGQPLTVLHGTDMTGHELAIFPGVIPARIPEPDFWPQFIITLNDLRPPMWNNAQARPHIRLDQVWNICWEINAMKQPAQYIRKLKQR